LAAAASDTTRVRVAAFIVLDGRVVLVRHRNRDSVYHLLPGGGVDYRETLADALTREVREETGLDVEIGALLFVNDTIDPNGTRHVVNLTFAANVVGGHVTDSPDDSRIEAVDLVRPESLSDLDLRPPMADALEAHASGSEPYPVYLGSLFSEAR